MKNDQTIKSPESKAGFTLIELLVVIAIIGVVAAMLLPTVGGIKATQLRKRAQTELAQVETAIERYKAAYGFYPPGNTNSMEVNQLYFELEGTTFDQANNLYKTLDSSAQISVSDVGSNFAWADFSIAANPARTRMPNPPKVFWAI
ncbi:MAG: type II secretion system protein [Limisphaerales bacterium]